MIKYFLRKPELPIVDLRFERRSSGASGYDLMANLGLPREISPGEIWSVPTGLYLEMPLGVEAQVRTRSGLARDWGVIVLNAPGTIDSDYRGEVAATLINLGRSTVTVLPGDRIAQLVFCPVYHQHDTDISQFGEFKGLSYDAGVPISPIMSVTRIESLDQLGKTGRGASGHGSTGR